MAIISFIVDYIGTEEHSRILVLVRFAGDILGDNDTTVHIHNY